MLSLVPAFGVTAVMLLGIRVRLSWRVAAIAAAVTVVVLAALTAFDLSRPADARTHLGRLAQQVADQGISPFVDTVARKVDANLDTWSSSEWRLVLLATVLFVAFLAICATRAGPPGAHEDARPPGGGWSASACSRCSATRSTTAA